MHDKSFDAQNKAGRITERVDSISAPREADMRGINNCSDLPRREDIAPSSSLHRPVIISTYHHDSGYCFTKSATPSASHPIKYAQFRRKNWRNRIRFLLKTNSSKSVLRLIQNRSYRPSADDVNQWAQSLDKLLGHKYGKAAFCIFLKSEFCEENIEFWTACEDFRTLTSHKELVSKASGLYEDFIKSEAPKEINLDFHTKNAIVQSLHDPTATSFLAAQRKVYSLMENNSYPRFIQSDLYKELCAVARGEGKHMKH